MRNNARYAKPFIERSKRRWITYARFPKKRSIHSNHSDALRNGIYVRVKKTEAWFQGIFWEQCIRIYRKYELSWSIWKAFIAGLCRPQARFIMYKVYFRKSRLQIVYASICRLVVDNNNFSLDACCTFSYRIQALFQSIFNVIIYQYYGKHQYNLLCLRANLRLSNNISKK